MRHLVLGTAGHIDHGKSALVRALTGIDPDRLKEEKRRGITIELGFADLDLGSERTLSFVDVPGHERFVRHMVAGAAGIDAVLLVVAADQGVQPQTREHLDICSLLGVRRGVVALTKCDLVDEELQEVVALELQELLTGTFLEEAPLVHASSQTGQGLEEIKGKLDALFDEIPARPVDGIARLPVDRSFVLHGFGTVVTGTLVSGSIGEGDEIEILPEGTRARIRGLQTHRHAQPVALAGQRTAINLQGVDCDDVPRGSTITSPGTLPTTRRAWARLTLLPDIPGRVARGGPVRFHQGTDDHAARFRVLGGSGEQELQVEIHFDEKVVLAPGDRFILRRPAPVDTVGGGVVVDVDPPRPRDAAPGCFAPDALEPASAIVLRLVRAAECGLDPSKLRRQLGLTEAQLMATLRDVEASDRTVRGGSRWFDASMWREQERRVVQLVGEYHERHPLHQGMSREGLRTSLAPEFPQDAWRDLLSGLERKGDLRLEGEATALPDHRVVLEGEAEELARRIGERFRQAGLEPPDLEAVLETEDHDRATPIVDLLLARGELVRIQDRRLFHAEALEALRAKLKEYAKTTRTIDVSTFKQLAGVTRKNAIPLLEQLDVERATRRQGNLREILL